jgi:antitoxin (DNA-binding transcriptional repressor) of toxin-antitoxin stability system
VSDSITLNTGVVMVSFNVSELQSKYAAVIEEATTGKDIALVRHGKNVVAMQKFDRYLEDQKEVLRAKVLDKKIERLEARMALLVAGGPSLAEVRRLDESSDMTPAEAIAQLRARRAQ